MAYWTDEMVLGIKLLDEQHKSLFEKLSELQNSMKEGKGKANAKELVPFLIDYARSHFLAEEGLMRIHGYPGYEEHKALHNGFRLEFLKVEGELAKGKVSGIIAVDISMKLSNWLYEHIKIEDGKMGKFLFAQGVR